MKQFSCGDVVVPGCSRTFCASSDEEILTSVAAHASTDHGLDAVPDSVLDQVRDHIIAA